MEAMTANGVAPTVSQGRTRASVIFSGMILLVVIAGAVATCRMGWNLWLEWRALEFEEGAARQAQFVGYHDIHIKHSTARPPARWLSQEDGELRIWAGWQAEVGHTWFRFSDGAPQLDRQLIQGPVGGSDMFRPIDLPIVEVGGGQCWERISPEATMAVVRVGEVCCVYPLAVLDKVQIIHDEVNDLRFLITFSPFVPRETSVEVFALPSQVGESGPDQSTAAGTTEMRMGQAGYFHDYRPMLFDRATRSLWVSQASGLKAVAGKHQGETLKRLTHAEFIAWSRCSRMFPQCRLIVGADRTVKVQAASTD